MDARRTEEVEGQRRLVEETVPFGEGKLGVDSAEDGDKMIFKRPDGTFGCINTVFLGRNTLKLNVVFSEGILEVMRTFVVQDM